MGRPEPERFEGLGILELAALSDVVEAWRGPMRYRKGFYEGFSRLSQGAQRALSEAWPEPFGELNHGVVEEMLGFYRAVEALPAEEQELVWGEVAEMVSKGEGYQGHAQGPERLG